MECEQAREALSALADDEDPGVQAAALDEHLGGCAACRAWSEAVQAASPLAEVTVEPGPHVLASVLASVTAERGALEEYRARRALAPWRVGLAAVAVIQPLVVLPSLVGGQWLGHAHDARELGSWHLALAVGFLVAACRPARAWGMLPLVAALVASLLVTAAVDMANGHVELANELAHAVDVVGLGCLWALSRLAQRRPLRLGLT